MDWAKKPVPVRRPLHVLYVSTHIFLMFIEREKLRLMFPPQPRECYRSYISINDVPKYCSAKAYRLRPSVPVSSSTGVQSTSADDSKLAMEKQPIVGKA